MFDIKSKTLLRIENWVYHYKNKKDVLFLVNNPLMFEHIFPIVKILEEDDRIRIWFCNSNGKMNLKSLLTKYMNAHRRINYKLARELKWDLIFYPMHDEYFRPQCSKIYVGHGLSVGKLMKDGRPYDFCSDGREKNGNLIYDKIFRSSEYIITKAKKAFPETERELRMVGSLYAEKFMSTVKETNSDIKTIVILSSWGDNSLFRQYGESIIPQISKLSEKYNIILSFHPNIKSKAIAEDILMLNNFKKLASNTVIINENPGGSLYCLAKADMIITDFTATGLYYSKLGRPIIYVECDGIIFDSRLSVMDEFIKITKRVSNTNNLLDKVNEGFRNFDPTETINFSKLVLADNAQELHRNEIYETLNLQIL